MTTVVVENQLPEAAGNPSAVAWPAIVAGGFVAAAFTLLLLALGAGLGLTVVSPWRDSPDITSVRTATSAGIYMAVTAVIASALGGYIAGRLRTRWAGVPADEVFFRDTAHGLLAWAFASVMGAILLASAATALTGAATAGAVQAAVQRPDINQGAVQPAGAPAALMPVLDRLFRPDYAALTGGTGQRAAGVFAAGRDLAVDRAAAARLLATGDTADRQYLAQMVAARTGVDMAEAERRVTAAETSLRSAAETARQVSMRLSLWLVASLFLGALAASLAAIEGGALRDGRSFTGLRR
jgi:hypothetical protein